MQHFPHTIWNVCGPVSEHGYEQAGHGHVAAFGMHALPSVSQHLKPARQWLLQTGPVEATAGLPWPFSSEPSKQSHLLSPTKSRLISSPLAQT